HLRELAEADPDRPAVIDEFAEFTRAQQNERVNRLVNGLRAAGVGAGEVVALLAGNRHEYVETVMACGVSSWVLVPLNWHLTGEELAYILNDSGARALIADVEFAATAADASPDEPDHQASGTYMFYTSGTTGRPKGVRSTAFAVGMPVSVHAALLGGLAGLLHIPDEGVCLVNAPLYHGGPFLFSMLPAYQGATLVMRRRFDPAEMLRLIDEYRVTTAYAVPTHFVRLLRLPDDVRAAF